MRKGNPYATGIKKKKAKRKGPWVAEWILHLGSWVLMF